MSFLEPVVGRLVGDNSNYISSLNDAERRTGSLADDTDRHFGRMGASIGKFAKVAAVGLTGAAAGIGLFAKSAIEAAEAGLKVDAQTRAVVESTGGIANVSAASVRKYADEMGRLTGIDDDLIASGQNMLLTFTNVRNEVGAGNDIFNQATKTVLNMSTALGQDTKTSAIQLGKALNDPIAGVSALQRVGVTFTDSQKKLIESLVESGDVLGAQKVILKELETEFGGSAEAGATATARLKVVVGQLTGELGERLLPVVNNVATFLADRLPGALDAVGRAWDAVMGGFQNADAGVGPGVGKLEAALLTIGAGARKLLDQFKRWWPAIQETVLGAIDAIVGWVRDHWPEIKRIITETLKAVQSVVKGVVDVITTIWENFGDQIKDVIRAAWEFVKSTIDASLKVVQGIVKTVTSLIHGDWSGVWEGIKMVLAGAWDFIMARVQFAIDIVKSILSVALEIIGAMWSGAWEGIKDFFAGVWDRMFDLARRGIANVVDAFLGMVGTIIHAADSAFGWIPGIGDKLHDARVAFDNFRDNVNRSLRGIEDKDVTIRLRYLEEHGVSQENNINRGTAGDPIYHEGGIVHGPVGADVRAVLQGGEGVFTRSQMAALGASIGSGGGGGNTYVVNVYTATGDIPDETMRKIRSQLFEMENDMPSGQIIPAA